MEEKTLIKSERYQFKKFFIALLIIGIIFGFVLSGANVSASIDTYESHEHNEFCYMEEFRDEYYLDYYRLFGEEPGGIQYGSDENLKKEKMDCIQITYDNAFSYALAEYFTGAILFSLFRPVLLFSAIGGLIYLWLRSYEMTVTDKRIFGKVIFGKRVDLPLDSISSTATIRLFKGVAVATSSGKIAFLAVKNSTEIFEKISALLVERQKEKNNNVPSQTTVVQTDEADKLKKFKELLDSGIITQEEFDAKKKELLGL